MPRYAGTGRARANRPLVVVFTLICFCAISSGLMLMRKVAYATGVLALMTSAALAVTLSPGGAAKENVAFC